MAREVLEIGKDTPTSIIQRMSAAKKCWNFGHFFSRSDCPNISRNISFTGNKQAKIMVIAVAKNRTRYTWFGAQLAMTPAVKMFCAVRISCFKAFEAANGK